MAKFRFLLTALFDWRVGAVFRTARPVVAKIIAAVPEQCQSIVEYGPGDGVITRHLIKHLAPNGRLYAIELNQRFVQALKDITDPRLTVLAGDVMAAIGQKPEIFNDVQTVVSGIPFSFFSPAIREEIISRTASILAPGGVFIVYQASPLVKPLLKKYFGSVTSNLSWRNLPPYWIMKAQKSLR